MRHHGADPNHLKRKSNYFTKRESSTLRITSGRNRALGKNLPLAIKNTIN